MFVGGGEILGGQGRIGGAQQPFAVQVRLGFDCGRVDPEQPTTGAAQIPAQAGLGLQRSDELVATPAGPAVGPEDQGGEVRDEPAADGGVPVGLFGVVADHEPLRPRTVVTITQAAGRDRDLLDPQVARDGAVAAGSGLCGGGLAVGVAQLLGVDVVPTTTGQVGPVGGGGEAAVGDPDPSGAGSSRPGRP